MKKHFLFLFCTLSLCLTPLSKAEDSALNTAAAIVVGGLLVVNTCVSATWVWLRYFGGEERVTEKVKDTGKKVAPEVLTAAVEAIKEPLRDAKAFAQDIKSSIDKTNSIIVTNSDKGKELLIALSGAYIFYKGAQILSHPHVSLPSHVVLPGQSKKNTLRIRSWLPHKKTLTSLSMMITGMSLMVFASQLSSIGRIIIQSISENTLSNSGTCDSQNSLKAL